MAEFTNANTVSVAAGQNVPLTETAVAGKGCVVHREGAGIVTLRGITNQCIARLILRSGPNIGMPSGGSVGPKSAAVAMIGDPLSSASATVTPAAVENYFNIYVTAFVEVPRGCCLTVAAENTSTQTVLFANANFMVERVS